MEKKLVFLFLTIFFLLFPKLAHADSVAGHSAILASNNTKSTESTEPNYFLKKLVIKKMMEKYQSPMADGLDAFIDTCKTYQLDCYLLPSIAILESTFGKFTYPGSHNPFGWGGGHIMFDSWAEGIEAVGKGLKQNYLDKGAVTVDQIAPIYAASPTWAVRVNAIKRQFEAEEEKIPLYLSDDRVQ